MIERATTYRIGKTDDMDWIMMFRNNLKYILKTKHITLRDVSKKMNMTTYKLSSYINGTTRLSDEMVKQIAEAVGCTIDELLDETYCSWNYGLTDEEITKRGKRFS